MSVVSLDVIKQKLVEYSQFFNDIDSKDKLMQNDWSLHHILKMTVSCLPEIVGLAPLQGGTNTASAVDVCVDMMMGICLADQMLGSNRLALSTEEIFESGADVAWVNVTAYLGRSKLYNTIMLNGHRDQIKEITTYKVHHLRLTADVCLMLFKLYGVAEFDTTPFTAECSARAFNIRTKRTQRFSENYDENEVWAVLYSIYEFYRSKYLEATGESESMSKELELDEALLKTVSSVGAVINAGVSDEDKSGFGRLVIREQNESGSLAQLDAVFPDELALRVARLPKVSFDDSKYESCLKRLGNGVSVNTILQGYLNGMFYEFSELVAKKIDVLLGKNAVIGMYELQKACEVGALPHIALPDFSYKYNFSRGVLTSLISIGVDFTEENATHIVEFIKQANKLIEARKVR